MIITGSYNAESFTINDYQQQVGEIKMYGGEGGDKREYKEWKKKLMEDLKQKKQFFQLAKKAGVFQ